ncbi:glycoside hydrolase family protein [Desulfuromonas thiophila]|uniref:glycoside hydrolase family protein n=1 Tax=Desulfuromonas thiophila TaxID=57664 RepID=UPI0029F4FB41|nr:glycoside hydrolase family protein [Desulfuromonas thiophila]
MTDLAEKLIMRHEGLRLKPYRCSAGRLSIGYGRNLEDNGISQDEALQLLRHDLAAARETLDELGLELDPVRQAVLLDMLYNLGAVRFRRFRFMLQAVRQGDFERAAREMLDSLWSHQVGMRAVKLAEMMRSGKVSDSVFLDTKG